MSIRHVKSNTVADQTGQITVGAWPNTSTMNATDNVVPADWNSGHLLAMTLGGNTAGVSSLSGTNFIFSGANNITLSGIQGANVATIEFSAGADTIDQISFSAGTSSAVLGSMVFSNSNGVSFGLNVSTVTASIATSLSAINISAGTTSNNLSQLSFANGSGVSFGLNGSTITASVAAAAGNVESYWFNNPSPAGASLVAFSGSTSYAFPFNPPTISANFFRLMAGLNNSSTSIASSVNTTIGYIRATTFNIAVYSQGTGASSQSLMSYTTATLLSRFSTTLSANANGSEYSVGMSLSYAQQSTTQSSTFSYASTRAGFDLFTTGFNIFSGTVFGDFPVAFSLAESNYWGMVGFTTTAAATGAAGGTVGNVGSHSWYNLAQDNFAPFVLGSTVGGPMLLGLGSFSTAGGGSTAALGLTNITKAANNPIPVLQIARI